MHSFDSGLQTGRQPIEMMLRRLDPIRAKNVQLRNVPAQGPETFNSIMITSFTLFRFLGCLGKFCFLVGVQVDRRHRRHYHI